MHFYRLIVFMVALLTVGLSGQVNAADLFVEGVRYGSSAGGTRIVIDFNKKPDYRAFLLDNPYRLVLDMPPVRWKTAQGHLVKNKIIKGYRSGGLEKDGLTRLVFDLRMPAVVQKSFTLGKTKTSKDRIVIDIKPASKILFMARLGDIYGNKDVVGNKAAIKPLSQSASLRNARFAKMTMLPTRKPTKASRRNRRYVIVIDPGHGGKDPGASGGGAKEKHITLQVSKALKRQLEETGRYDVVLTRSRDKFIKLRERVAISRKANADLFISIHADKISRKNVRGASIYTLSEKASDAESARLAEQENTSVSGVDLKGESQDIADILLDLAMREKMNESKFLARVVHRAFTRKRVRLLPNAHRSAGFAVLKAPDVPSILIETGFLSNPQEAKLLRSAPFQRKLASGIMAGINAYFRKIQALHKVQ